MGEYEVRYKILEPDSMGRDGKVKFRNTGHVGNPVTVTADSPEEAKKAARKSPAITKALDRARKNTPFNVLEVAKPRVRFGDVTVKGVKGGGGGGGMFDLTDRDEIPRLARGGVVKKMKGGGCVMSGRGTKFRGVR